MDLGQVYFRAVASVNSISALYMMKPSPIDPRDYARGEEIRLYGNDIIKLKNFLNENFTGEENERL
jgi:hypothetical protein